MISLNGSLQKESQISLETNRGFLYGDALFDTLIYRNNQLVFLEAHYFRLLASMRQLRMEIPNFFTQAYWEEQILQTIHANSLKDCRVRTSVFRDSKGLYTPFSNSIQFIIQVSPLTNISKNIYELGLYKENYTNTSPISNLKTTNRITNVLASLFAKENGFDTCLLLNEKKQVAEVTHANIFIVNKNEITTPPLSEGCINGIVRQKLIEIIKKDSSLKIKESTINPFDLQKADEVFITNSVLEIQAITHYKKKTYSKLVSEALKKKLAELIEKNN